MAIIKCPIRGHCGNEIYTSLYRVFESVISDMKTFVLVVMMHSCFDLKLMKNGFKSIFQDQEILERTRGAT